MASQPSDQPQQREISIFWDYENLALPSWSKPADACKSIVKLVSKYGRIVDRRLYNDFSNARGQQLWSSLDSSGFDLVNTPRRNQKETLDKKLIADVLTFAWDSAVRNDNCKPCVVLLTSDGDYAYCLSKLRDRGVMSIVMFGPDAAVANILRETADIPLDFEKDVLLSSSAGRTQSLLGSAIKSSDFASSRAKQNGAKDTQGNHSAVPNEDNDIKTICTVIAKKEKGPEEWLAGGTVAADFGHFLGPCKDRKDRYKNARVSAVQDGLIEQGRRRLQGTLKGGIECVGGRAINPKHFSNEDYLRLSRAGFRLIGKDFKITTSKQQPSRTIISPGPVEDSTVGALILCKVATKEQKGDEWLVSSTPAEMYAATSLLGKLPPLERKERYRAARTRALKNGWLEQGRRVLCGPNKDSIESTDDASFDRNYYSLEDYLRVTTKGKQAAAVHTLDDDSNSAASSKSGARNYDCQSNNGRATDESSADHTGLCRSMVKIGTDNEWLSVSKIGPSFASENPKLSNYEIRERFKKARADAQQQGSVEEGRRVLCGPKKNEIEKVNSDSPLDGDYYSLEEYLRLTTKGTSTFAVGQNTIATSRHLFLKNVPRNAKIQELVDHLEKTHNCSVARAFKYLGKGVAAPCFARVEMENLEDAAKIVSLSKKSMLILSDRTMDAASDSFPSAKYNGDPILYYEKDTSTERLPSSGSSSMLDDTSSMDSADVSAEHENFYRLFIKNIPKSIKIDALVHFLEESHGCSVIQAKLEPFAVASPFCFARVQVESIEQAEKLLELSKLSMLLLEERRLEVSHDQSPPRKLLGGEIYKRDSKEFFEPDIFAICKVLNNDSPGLGWVEGATLSSRFKDSLNISGHDEMGKQRFKNARFRGCSKGFIEVGRRKLGWGSAAGQIEPLSRNFQFVGQDYSKEIYIRLTTEGKSYFLSSSEPRTEPMN